MFRGRDGDFGYVRVGRSMQLLAEQSNQTRKRVIRTVESVGSAIVGQGEGMNEQRVEHECGRRKGTARRLLSVLSRAFKVPDTDGQRKGALKERREKEMGAEDEDESKPLDGDEARAL